MEQEYKDTNNPMPPWRIDKTKPIGHNTLSNVMTNLSEICEFDEPLGGGRQTNAAGRHLCVTRMASEGVAQRETNMHVRHSTRETTMQYQEINVHTENMRHEALMPDRKKVEQFIRERHERVMKKALAKAIVSVLDTLSNVTVPLEMTSFNRPAKRLQQQSLRREPLIVLTQNGDTIQSNRCQATSTSILGTPHEVFGRNTKQVIGLNIMAKKQKNGMTQPQFANNFDKFVQSQNAINGINPRAMNQKQLNLKQPQFNMKNGHINKQGNWANNQDNTRTSR
jgi:tRNA pseudouridine-54 N-methylase